MSDYPEHDRLSEVSEQSQACGEFYQWLRDNGYRILETVPTEDPCFNCHGTGKVSRGDNCPICHGTGIVRDEIDVPPRASIQDLLGAFFSIDPQRLAEEKDAMLRSIRAAS